VCGRTFKTSKGMKIHRTKMGCLNLGLRQRSTSSEVDKTSETSSQEANHSARSIQAKGFDADITNVRERIKFPQASEPIMWANLDKELCQQFSEKVKGSLKDKIRAFSDAIYEYCKGKFSIVEKRTKKVPGKSRRQNEIEDIRRQKKDARRQWKAAAEHERVGLKEIYSMLKQRHSDLCKAEAAKEEA